jgi:hypothetical protein
MRPYPSFMASGSNSHLAIYRSSTKRKNTTTYNPCTVRVAGSLLLLQLIPSIYIYIYIYTYTISFLVLRNNTIQYDEISCICYACCGCRNSLCTLPTGVCGCCCCFLVALASCSCSTAMNVCWLWKCVYQQFLIHSRWNIYCGVNSFFRQTHPYLWFHFLLYVLSVT